MGSGKQNFILGGTVLALVATTACSQTSVVTAPSAKVAELKPERGERQTRVPKEYLVTLASGADEKALSERYGHLGIQRIDAMGNGMFRLSLANDPGPQAMEDLMRSDKRIKAVQPNFIYRTQRAGGKAE